MKQDTLSQTSLQHLCPACNHDGTKIIYEVDQVPVHSVLTHKTRSDALHITTGNLRLAFCAQCGLISNAGYDPLHENYQEESESTQSYSAAFSSFSQQLASYLINTYQLYDKRIIEIGCGMGEFLIQICELGQNHGLGFDPAYRDRLRTSADVHFIQDYYSEHYSVHKADFIICKMTLEHIYQPRTLIELLYRTFRDQPQTIVFFQVPDMTRILSEFAFWDIYYEHISYFNPHSIASLFQRAGFTIHDIWKAYADQYLLLTASFQKQERNPPLIQRGFQDYMHAVQIFSQDLPGHMSRFQSALQLVFEKGKKIVLWGAGSKAVSLLTSLHPRPDIHACVDINPHKHNTYMAGTGQEIIPPQILVNDQPDLIIAMNPIYVDEIQNTLNQLQISSPLIPVNDVYDPKNILHRL